jgi:hypothetical protein
MKFRTEVRKFMEDVESHLGFKYGHERVLTMLQDENARLREENSRLIRTNNQLLDRIMSRDFEQFAVFQQPEPDQKLSETMTELQINQDQNNIGEVVEDGS